MELLLQPMELLLLHTELPLPLMALLPTLLQHMEHIQILIMVANIQWSRVILF
jgi:hypothetical protein